MAGSAGVGEFLDLVGEAQVGALNPEPPFLDFADFEPPDRVPEGGDLVRRIPQDVVQRDHVVLADTKRAAGSGDVLASTT